MVLRYRGNLAFQRRTMNIYEIQELLADFENRISFLENSVSPRIEKVEEQAVTPKKPEVLISAGEFRNLERRLNSHLDAHKKGKLYKTYI